MCLFLCEEFSVFLHLALEMVYDNLFCISRSNIMRRHVYIYIYVYICMHLIKTVLIVHLMGTVFKYACSQMHLDLSKTLQLRHFVFHCFLPNIVGNTK